MQGVEGGAAEGSGSQAWALATSPPQSPTYGYCNLDIE